MHVGKLNFISDYNDDDEEEKLNSEPDSDMHVVQRNVINAMITKLKRRN